MDLKEFQNAKESLKIKNDMISESKQASTPPSPSLDCLESNDANNKDNLIKIPTTTYMPEAKTKKLSDEDKAMDQIITNTPSPATTVIFNPPVNVHLLENTRVSDDRCG